MGGLDRVVEIVSSDSRDCRDYRYERETVDGTKKKKKKKKNLQCVIISFSHTDWPPSLWPLKGALGIYIQILFGLDDRLDGINGNRNALPSPGRSNWRTCALQTEMLFLF